MKTEIKTVDRTVQTDSVEFSTNLLIPPPISDGTKNPVKDATILINTTAGEENLLNQLVPKANLEKKQIQSDIEVAIVPPPPPIPPGLLNNQDRSGVPPPPPPPPNFSGLSGSAGPGEDKKSTAAWSALVNSIPKPKNKLRRLQWKKLPQTILSIGFQ